MHGLAAVLAAAFAVACAVACATVPRIEDLADKRRLLPFVKDEGFSELALSTDGTHFATISTVGAESALTIFNVSDAKPVASFGLPKYRGPFDDRAQVFVHIQWVSDRRVAAALGIWVGPLELPYGNGEILSVGFDGNDWKKIFGERSTDEEIVPRLTVGEIGGLVPTVPSTIWVHGTRYSKGKYDSSAVYRVNASTGEQSVVTEGPKGWVIGYQADESGNVRVATVVNENNRQELYVLNGNVWAPLPNERDLWIKPMGYSDARHTFYAITDDAKGPALMGLDVETNTWSDIIRLPEGEPSQIIFDPVDHAPVAVAFEVDYPTWKVLEPDRNLAKALALVLAKYPGYQAELTSAEPSGTLSIFEVYTDRFPGQYALVDLREQSVRPLLNVSSLIDGSKMSPVEAFKVRASDGVMLHGYLTLPKGADRGPAPMIVLPHGGPFDERDHWRFDSDSQALAAAGFVVLRVNFRGSSGYGSRFAHAGYGKWSDRIQDDIIEATRWAIAEKVADPKRIAIMGASFGGYSAMQSAIRAPGLFRCAVGYSGLYDLAKWQDEGDVGWTVRGRAYVARAIGTNDEARREASPLYHADKIRIPILLIHGTDDKRAPFEHAKKLCKALAHAKPPCESFFISDEGHGFVNDAHRAQALERALDFIEKVMGPAK